MTRTTQISGSALILTLALAILPGRVALAGDFDKPHFYAVLGGLTGFESFQNVGRLDFDNSLGFQMRFGVRGHKYLALELEGDFISGFDVDVLPIITGEPLATQGKLSADGGNVTVNARVYFPLGRFQPYGLVGIGGNWMRLRSRNYTGAICQPSWGWGYWCDYTKSEFARGGGFVTKLGGGIDIWLTEKFGFSFDGSYVLSVGDLENFTYTNFGWGAIMKF